MDGRIDKGMDGWVKGYGLTVKQLANTKKFETNSLLLKNANREQRLN